MKNQNAAAMEFVKKVMPNASEATRNALVKAFEEGAKWQVNNLPKMDDTWETAYDEGYAQGYADCLAEHENLIN